MKNNQLFPFERNRYYAGKLLTSADFSAEQLYMNNKRRFLNRILFGSGVVCGLNVVNLDDLSILVESGVAIDRAGREIVVDSSVVKKLSGLSGFDALGSERAGLYIRYHEEAVHDVYCGDLGADGREYERNRIDEGYELYLKDCDEPGQAAYRERALERFVLREKILDNADYTVQLSMPYTVAKGYPVKLVVTIRKNSEKAKALSFHARMQMPSLIAPEGGHELAIEVDSLSLPMGQQVSKDHWLYVEPVEADETTVLCRKEDMHFQVGGYEIEPGNGVQFRLLLSEQMPFDLAVGEVGRTTLDDDLREDAGGDVCIAVLQLLRTDVSCLVSGIAQQGVKRYIITPGKAGQREALMAYFDGSSAVETKRETAKGDPDREHGIYRGIHRGEAPLPMASGRLEIPLDVNMKKGDICVSEEIMHGLGRGNVYVEVGTEYLDDAPYNRGSRRNTIFGNPELFGFRECMEVETAVRVLNDKGSFQVAAKLLGEQKSIVLQLGWVAVRFGSVKDSDEMQEEENRSIVPETPTVRLRAKESYYFNVSFHNLQPCRLSYELTEPGSGEITADGMYTAPAKEGVYEIYIYCTDMPKISTYVYAVVNKELALGIGK
ncbi:MAG: hypothetical protein K1W23_00845 [Lachnospiraceae bacterium]